MRFLALGDSYTIGEGVAEDQRWPNQWASALRALGAGIDAPRIIAQTGWTTDELSAAIDALEPLGQWDLVSLLIGVNNQYRGRDLQNYRAEFSALLERATAYAGGDPGRVLVLSIPDWGVTPFARDGKRDLARIADEIDDYNAVNRDVSETRGAVWRDITDLTRDYGARRDMLADDGLHPSGAMYALWVERLMDTM
ncbi:SGNH/GDSL hydrolase family protein [Arenimonas sp.]|uniref:SGNH/GDSL hydrolase family protein n=1 Tax=Arenimonas sp. TaxID=1872635 RepID=UPI0039E4E8C1